MNPYSTGRGTTGIGENFARARLLLAKRAGYLPQNQQFPQRPGEASAMWHSASKNLNTQAKAAGYPHPNAYLRAGITMGGNLPRPMARGGRPMTPSLPYYASTLAQTPMAMNPFQGLGLNAMHPAASWAPPGLGSLVNLAGKLPPLPPLPKLPPMGMMGGGGGRRLTM